MVIELNNYPETIKFPGENLRVLKTGKDFLVQYTKPQTIKAQ